jgi:replication factor C subunit 3/5
VCARARTDSRPRPPPPSPHPPAPPLIPNPPPSPPPPQVKLEHRPFKTPSGKTIELTTVASNYHIELNPGDAGIYDRFVVQELIKEMAGSAPLDVGPTGHAFKVVLLSEVDRLTKEAQASLRRTMEKYSGTCRLILVCTSPSKVIEPVRSRCLGIRVAAPTQQEMMAVLTATATKEGLQLPTGLAAKLAAQSGRNLRRALLMLEAAKVAQYPFSPAQSVPLMDYERFILLLAIEICKDQSPRALLNCRARIYELLVNCVPADVIVKKLVGAVLERVATTHETVKHEIAAWAAHYEHRMQLGSKEVFHVEALCARLMSVIKANAGCLAPGATGTPREVFGEGSGSGMASTGGGGGAGGGAGSNAGAGAGASSSGSGAGPR